MKRTTVTAWALLGLALPAGAAVITERWGGKGKALAHAGTLKVISGAQIPRLVFDLSAVPKATRVYHASLHCSTSGGQPRQPVRIYVTDRLGGDGKPAHSGKPLALEPPYYRSFDATRAVQAWVNDPRKNLGLAVVQFDAFQAGGTFLEVRYEGKPADLPEPVTHLRAVHHDGQTFLIWRELEMFRPGGDKIFWVSRYNTLKSEKHEGPGEGFGGLKRIPAVTLKTLRDLKGLSVRGKKGPRSMQPIEVVKELPVIRYRVYRSDRPITAKTIAEAELLGEVAPCSAIIERMLSIITHGEYYDPWEHPDSVLLTWCYENNKAVLPGEALYVHTPQAKGRSHYAVTVMRNGRENTSAFAAGNSLPAPLAETPATPQPVLQYVTPDSRDRNGLQRHHAYWPAPPVCNLPLQDPRRVLVGVRPNDKPPYGLVVNPSASGMFFGGRTTAGSIHLTVEQDIAYGADLGYSQGRGTLRSFAESKVDYYSEKYIMANVTWAMKNYRIDRARITCRANPHMALRNGEFFRVLFLGPYELDMNRRWNPGSGSLGGLFGPAETAMTVDGHKAWEIVDIRYQLSVDPARDIPYMACFFTQPKDGNHGAEYGWQDDSMGLAALRDHRQPYLMQWGGASVAREVSSLIHGLRWDKSVPAFSNCSLDNNPGTGDPDAGDPWGQINGYLAWDYQTIVDQPGRWEMTVYLVGSAPESTCTVDLTPRQCRKFKPTKGQGFKWSSVSPPGGRTAASGTVTADQWGLVTIRGLPVSKAKTRVTIKR